MMDRESKHGWAWRGEQNSPGLCRPWLVFGIVLTASHVRVRPQAVGFPVRGKAGSRREDNEVQRKIIQRQALCQHSSSTITVSPMTFIQGQPRTLAASALNQLVFLLCCGPVTVGTRVTQLPNCCRKGKDRSEVERQKSWEGVSGANRLPGRLSPHATFTLARGREVGNDTSSWGRRDTSMSPR